jgi:hypothetical protein
VAVSEEVVDPGGKTFVLRIRPAPGMTLFFHGPWRMWAGLRNDRSWWLNVDDGVTLLPIVRERYLTEDDAHDRLEAIRSDILNGRFSRRWPQLWRRSRTS